MHHAGGAEGLGHRAGLTSTQLYAHLSKQAGATRTLGAVSPARLPAAPIAYTQTWMHGLHLNCTTPTHGLHCLPGRAAHASWRADLGWSPLVAILYLTLPIGTGLSSLHNGRSDGASKVDVFVRRLEERGFAITPRPVWAEASFGSWAPLAACTQGRTHHLEGTGNATDDDMADLARGGAHPHQRTVAASAEIGPWPRSTPRMTPPVADPALRCRSGCTYANGMMARRA